MPPEQEGTEIWAADSQLVALVASGVNKLRRYTTFATAIKVMVPTGEEAVVVADPTTHMRLRAQVVDL